MIAVKEESVSAVCIAGIWHNIVAGSFKFTEVQLGDYANLTVAQPYFMFKVDDSRMGEQTVVAHFREIQAIQTSDPIDVSPNI